MYTATSLLELTPPDTSLMLAQMCSDEAPYIAQGLRGPPPRVRYLDQRDAFSFILDPAVILRVAQPYIYLPSSPSLPQQLLSVRFAPEPQQHPPTFSSKS